MSGLYIYPVTEGDIVCHTKEPNRIGMVLQVDRGLPHPTTCAVLWDGYEPEDYGLESSDELVRL